MLAPISGWVEQATISRWSEEATERMHLHTPASYPPVVLLSSGRKVPFEDQAERDIITALTRQRGDRVLT